MFHYAVDDEVVLRMFEHRHAAELHQLTNLHRTYLRRWLPWVDNIRSIHDTHEFIQRGMDQFAKSDGIQVGVWAEGNLAGALGMHRVDWMHRYTSVGYWLAETYTGQGVMTRAVGALLKYVFDDLSLNRAEMRVATENVPSQHIAERLGFTLEGTARQAEWLYDHYVDQNVYSMLADEWRAKQASA